MSNVTFSVELLFVLSHIDSSGGERDAAFVQSEEM